MTSYVKSVTVDCGEPLRLAEFWASALGSDVDDDSTPDRAFVGAAGWGGPDMWFVSVPEGKSAKNRLHFDLRPHGERLFEINRLKSMGASVLHDGDKLTVMADPEGNEFCVE